MTDGSNESANMNENQYLEMVNQLKEKFDKNEVIVNNFIKANIDLKKDLMMAYSLVRIIDDEEFVDSRDIGVMLTMLRSILSNIIETKVICCGANNDNDSDNLNSELILHFENINDLP